jgi:hypothetical protein
VLEAVMVRRLKEDLRPIVAGLPERRVEEIVTDGRRVEAPELRVSVLLADYAIRRVAAEAGAGLGPHGVGARDLEPSHAPGVVNRGVARTLRVHR